MTEPEIVPKIIEFADRVAAIHRACAKAVPLDRVCYLVTQEERDALEAWMKSFRRFDSDFVVPPGSPLFIRGIEVRVR